MIFGWLVFEEQFSCTIKFSFCLVWRLFEEQNISKKILMLSNPSWILVLSNLDAILMFVMSSYNFDQTKQASFGYHCKKFVFWSQQICLNILRPHWICGSNYGCTRALSRSQLYRFFSLQNQTGGKRASWERFFSNCLCVQLDKKSEAALSSNRFMNWWHFHFSCSILTLKN